MKELEKELQEQGEELIAASLERLIEGSKEHARRFYRDMSRDLAAAALIKDKLEREEVVAETRAQVKAALELNRLTIVNESWELFENLFEIAAKGIVIAGQVGLTAAELSKKGGLA